MLANRERKKMKKRIFQILLILVLASLVLSACLPEPDLNRPWYTATPKAGSASSGAQTSSGAAPIKQSTATPAAQASGPVSGEKIIIGEDEANPPFMYADASGQATGLYVELTRTALERMGMAPEFQALPWKRVLEASAKGEMGVAGIYKNDERLKIYDYSEPLYSERILVYVAKGKAFEFKSVADLKGKTIGVMTGWSYGNDFDQAKAAGEFTAQEAPGDAENLEKLVLGRVDCVLAAEVSAIPVIQEKGYADKVEALPEPMTVNDTYLIFAKSANRVELLKTFNSTLAAMKQDGTYNQLVKKWTGVDAETTDAPAAATLPPETIVIGEDEANPPFMYADANGQAIGLYVDLTRTALERMGMTPQFQALPWKRVLDASAKGEMGVAGIYKNDERLKIYDYSEPLYSERILVYVAKGKAFEFKSVADLKGKTIGVMTGWSYGNDFDQAKAAGEFTVQEAPGDAENLEKLVLGRVDCVLAAEASAIPVILEKGYADKVEALPEPLTVNDTYLVFAKSVNRVEFLKVFNATLAAMKQDGTYDQLVEKWIGKGQ